MARSPAGPPPPPAVQKLRLRYAKRGRLRFSSHRVAHQLRSAGIRAEMYLGTSGMKAQMKYADRRGAPCVVIEGSDERGKGQVQIKDLIEGAKAASAIKDNAAYKAARPAQLSVARSSLVEAVREIVGRHSVGA